MTPPAPPFHMIDFEGSLASGIVEYGIAVIEGKRVTRLHTRLCRPTGRIRKEDTAVHGLEATALQSREPFTNDFDLFATLRLHGPFAAHHAQAENSLLRASWPVGRQAPSFVRENEVSNDWGPWLDSAGLYRHVFGKEGRGSLQDLVVRFGLQPLLDASASDLCPEDRRRYHAAPYDALAAALLFVDLLKRPEFADATLPWLLQASTSNAEKRARLQQDDLLF